MASRSPWTISIRALRIEMAGSVHASPAFSCSEKRDMKMMVKLSARGLGTTKARTPRRLGQQVPGPGRSSGLIGPDTSARTGNRHCASTDSRSRRTTRCLTSKVSDARSAALTIRGAIGALTMTMIQARFAGSSAGTATWLSGISGTTSRLCLPQSTI